MIRHSSIFVVFSSAHRFGCKRRTTSGGRSRFSVGCPHHACMLYLSPAISQKVNLAQRSFCASYCRVEQLLCFLLMFQVTLVSPSGRSESISLPRSSKVRDLKILAQKSFQQGLLRLVTADGRILGDPSQSLVDAQVEDKDCLTAVALQATVATTKIDVSGSQAFALWCCGGSRILTWGHPRNGGDSSAVQDQLRNVQQVHSTSGAFAAILADGSVVTWGHPGSDSSAMQDKLTEV